MTILWSPYYGGQCPMDIVHWTLSNGHFCFVYFFFVLFFFFTFLRMNHFVHASHKHSKYSVFYLSNKEDAFHILDDWPVFHLALINSSYQIDTIETSISFSLAIYIIQNNLKYKNPHHLIQTINHASTSYRMNYNL